MTTDIVAAGVDLRSHAVRAGPVPELFAAPRVRAGVRRRSVVLGAAEPSTLEQLTRWWQGLSSRLHQAIYSRTVGSLTGLKVPAEASDPMLARDYLADMLVSQGQLRGWDRAEVARYATAIRALAPAGGVVATIDRVLTLTAPPRTWPGVDAWFALAEQLKGSAALLSAGEAAGKWQGAAAAALQRAREGLLAVAPDVRAVVETGAKTAADVSKQMVWVAPAVGIGALVVLGGAALAAAGVMFAPELTAAAGVAAAAKGTGGRKR